MGKVELDDLVSVQTLGKLRKQAGAICTTTQGIYSQIRAVERQERTPEEVGFEIVRIDDTMVRLKIIDPALVEFRKKLQK